MDDMSAGNPRTKSEIRRYILKTRDNMPLEDRTGRDAEIRERVLRHEAYRDARLILAYASYRSEVDTTVLIGQALADGKYVFAPRVSGDGMEFWRIMSLEDLHSGYRGIPEPVQSISFPEWIALKAGDVDINNKTAMTAMMWMPGAAFDRERRRIGYGKGFYDRYLSKISSQNGHINIRNADFRLITAALAYTCQIVRQIPYEPHDIRPDMVITEKGILHREAAGRKQPSCGNENNRRKQNGIFGEFGTEGGCGQV